MKSNNNIFKNMMIIVGVLFFIMIGLAVLSYIENPEEFSGDDEEPEETSVEVIDDVAKYSRIPTDDLVEMMGEPETIETWTKQTNNYGDFEVTTYGYDKDGMRYEFIVGDDAVVRLSIYSNDYWNGEGERFSYNEDNKVDTMDVFGVEWSDNARKLVDNNITYKIISVSDKIAHFMASDIDTEDKTFGFVKVTYNVKYFD